MTSRPISTLSLPRATISALARAGYETAEDLASARPEELAKDLHVSVPQSQGILSASQRIPVTQSASSLIHVADDVFHCCPPIDKLLGGGLTRGHILEISGPPGTSKGFLALNIIRDYVEQNEEVVVIDPQNMITPGTIDRTLRQSSSMPAHYKQLVRLLNVTGIPEFMAFIHNLPLFLDNNPKVTLLVISSFSFFLQSAPPSANLFSWRKSILGHLKPIFAKVCSSQKLSIVITTQLATKMVGSDGKNANFETGSRAIMVPNLGDSHLPSGRTYRIIIVPESRSSGRVPITGNLFIRELILLTASTLRLISSPLSPSGKGPSMEERFRMVNGIMEMY